jgi:DNA-binding transcriptional MerR regulator
MKHTEILAEAKFIKHSQAAKFHDVHPRTIDRWAAQGLIPKPVTVNGLKYYDVEALAAAGTRRG